MVVLNYQAFNELKILNAKEKTDIILECQKIQCNYILIVQSKHTKHIAPSYYKDIEDSKAKYIRYDSDEKYKVIGLYNPF